MYLATVGIFLAKFKYIFHVKIRLIVTLQADQDSDPDPLGSALFMLDPDQN